MLQNPQNCLKIFQNNIIGRYKSSRTFSKSAKCPKINTNKVDHSKFGKIEISILFSITLNITLVHGLILVNNQKTMQWSSCKSKCFDSESGWSIFVRS